MPLKITNFSNAILQNISFELAKGDNLIIMGENGVGKSTLAKILSGITPSDTVNIDGICPSQNFGQSRAKRINYIPPTLEIFDSFISVREFLALSCFETIGSDALASLYDEAKAIVSELSPIDQVLKTLKLTHLASQTCHTLSSGQSQLLLIASAFLHQADYTIFDEPTANLDPQKIQMLFKVLQNALEGKSKILITHHLDFAYKLGFDILFLAEGEIAFYGKSKDFFEAKHLYKIYQGAVIKENNTMMVKL